MGHGSLFIRRELDSSVHKDDRLQINDLYFHKRGQYFDRLGLESWERCKCGQFFGRLRPLLLSCLQVLNRSGIGDIFPFSRGSGFGFLDDFRLLASTGRSTLGEGGLDVVLFDTSLPQQSPDSWRRLNIDPAHLGRVTGFWADRIRVHTDHDGSLGEVCHDRPLIVDPTQSVVVVAFGRERGDSRGRGMAFVIRAAVLIKHMSSACSGQDIPWEDWMGDGVIVEIPSYFRIFVLGTRVLLIRYDWRRGYHIRGYNFCRLGRRALVHVRDGGKKSWVVPNPDVIWSQIEPDHAVDEMYTLGDSLVVCSVRNSHKPIKHAVNLRRARKEHNPP